MCYWVFKNRSFWGLEQEAHRIRTEGIIYWVNTVLQEENYHPPVLYACVYSKNEIYFLCPFRWTGEKEHVISNSVQSGFCGKFDWVMLSCVQPLSAELLHQLDEGTMTWHAIACVALQGWLMTRHEMGHTFFSKLRCNLSYTWLPMHWISRLDLWSMYWAERIEYVVVL